MERINILEKKFQILTYKYPSKKYNEIKNELINLYSKCEPDENLFKPLMKKSSVIFIKYRKRIIGFTVITPNKLLKKYKDYKKKGGLKENGLFLTSLCGNNKYKGIGPVIFKYLDQYAEEHNYTYIGLHVSKERPRLKLFYEKNGFKNIDYLSKINKNFFIMRKDY